MPGDLVVPMVHLHGTARDTLMEQWSDAVAALADARNALAACVPNMRDFYLQPDCDRVYALAVTQHASRMARVMEVQAEIEAIRQEVADGP